MTFAVLLGAIAGTMYIGYMWLGKMVAEAGVVALENEAAINALLQAAGSN